MSKKRFDALSMQKVWIILGCLQGTPDTFNEITRVFLNAQLISMLTSSSCKKIDYFEFLWISPHALQNITDLEREANILLRGGCEAAVPRRAARPVVNLSNLLWPG